MPDDVTACVTALKCMAFDVHPVEWCERTKHCPFAYQRRRDQDRAEREKKDRDATLTRPEGGSPMRILLDVNLDGGRFPDTGTPAQKKEVLEHVLRQVVAPAITFSTEHIDRKVEIKALDGSRVGELELLRA
jgi:hypothetical protein